MLTFPIGLLSNKISLDLEVEAWEARVIANSGTVSATTLDRVNTFVLAVKSAGLRSRFLRLNLFIGDQLSAGLTPLFLNETESTSIFYGNTYDTNNNFVGGDYVESGATGGLQGNGSNKYLDTGFNANTVTAMNLNTSGQFVYSRTQTPTTGGTLMGSNDQSAPASQFKISWNVTTLHGMYFQGGASNGIADGRGILLGSRFTSTSYSLYVNGGTPANGVITSVKKPNYPIHIFAQNVGGTTNQYTNALINCYGIIDGVAGDAEALTISTLLNDFYTLYSRNEY